MHRVAVARERYCRVGVLDEQLHKVGPMIDDRHRKARACLCKAMLGYILLLTSRLQHENRQAVSDGIGRVNAVP